MLDFRLRWSDGWSTSAHGLLSAFEQGDTSGWMTCESTKCLVLLTFLPEWTVHMVRNCFCGLLDGWNRIGLTILILHATAACFTGGPVIMRGHCKKCNSLHPQIHYLHFLPLMNSYIHHYAVIVTEMIMGIDALYAGCGRRSPRWWVKEVDSSLVLWLSRSPRCSPFNP